MTERNEPSTAEIVRALRCDGDANNCVDCRYATYDTATILCDQEQNVRDAADRLESQAKENEISRHLIEMQSNVITELTARAEQAERERDAAVDDMRGVCAYCKHFRTDDSAEPCLSCSWSEGNNKPGWEWRGLRGKENDGKD